MLAEEPPFRLDFAKRLKKSGFTYKEIASELNSTVRIVRSKLNPEYYDTSIPADLLKERLEQVARVTGLRQDAIMSATKLREVVRARWILMWVLYEVDRTSMYSIGEALGGLNHSTISHAYWHTELAINRAGLDKTTDLDTLIRKMYGLQADKFRSTNGKDARRLLNRPALPPKDRAAGRRSGH